jgi:hypothetical protein
VPRADARFRENDPTDSDNTLFLEFGDLDPEPDAVLNFANVYGPLGEGAVGGEGETLDSWRNAINWVGMLVTLWTAARQYNTDLIREYIRREKGSFVCRGLPDIPCAALGDPFRIEKKDIEPLGLGADAFESAALIVVHHALNVASAAVAQPSLFLHPEYPETEGTVFWYRCKSLFGVLVAQFFDALVHDIDFQKCVACGEWFERGADLARSDRLTCSDACRQKLHRTRKARALELHAQGKKAHEIALETGSDVQTIKGWIARAKED